LEIEKINLEYTLHMFSRFHCGTGYSFGLVDRMARKDHSGYLLISGSTVKGLVRENCERILAMCDLEPGQPQDEIKEIMHINRPRINDMIFGSKFHPGMLYFNNAELSEDDKVIFDGPGTGGKKRYLSLQTKILTQTSISRRLGVVKQKSLFNSEYGINQLTFKGRIFGMLQGMSISELGIDSKGTDSLLLTLAGLLMIENMGSDRTRGAGKCRVDITNLMVDDIETDPCDILTAMKEFPYLYLERG